eukprot:7379075-Prymnesium_polylepis.1
MACCVRRVAHGERGVIGVRRAPRRGPNARSHRLQQLALPSKAIPALADVDDRGVERPQAEELRRAARARHHQRQSQQQPQPRVRVEHSVDGGIRRRVGVQPKGGGPLPEAFAVGSRLAKERTDGEQPAAAEQRPVLAQRHQEGNRIAAAQPAQEERAAEPEGRRGADGACRGRGRAHRERRRRGRLDGEALRAGEEHGPDCAGQQQHYDLRQGA